MFKHSFTTLYTDDEDDDYTMKNLEKGSDFYNFFFLLVLRNPKQSFDLLIRRIVFNESDYYY